MKKIILMMCLFMSTIAIQPSDKTTQANPKNEPQIKAVNYLLKIIPHMIIQNPPKEGMVTLSLKKHNRATLSWVSAKNNQSYSFSTIIPAPDIDVESNKHN